MGGASIFHSCIRPCTNKWWILFANVAVYASLPDNLSSSLSSSHSLPPNYSFTVNGLEKLEGEQAVREREDLIRSKVSSVIPCNVFNNPPVPFSAESFDIIHCCSVIESACKTKAEFEDCVRQLWCLLRPRGHIVMLVQIERNQYTIGNSVFPVVYLTIEDVHESMRNAGFVVISTSLYHIPKEALQIYSGMKAFAVVVGDKTDSWKELCSTSIFKVATGIHLCVVC